jgi:hypothetical protein
MCRPGTSKKVSITPGYEPDLDAITKLCPVPLNVDTPEVAAIFECTMKGGPKARMPICPDAAVLASIAKLSKPASEQGKKRGRISSSSLRASDGRNEEQEADVEETQVFKRGGVRASSHSIAVSEPSSDGVAGCPSGNSVRGAMASSSSAHTSGALMKTAVEANTTKTVFSPSTLQSVDTDSFAMRDLLVLQLHQQQQQLEDASRRNLFSQLSQKQSAKEYIMQLRHRQEQEVFFTAAALQNNMLEGNRGKSQMQLLQHQQLVQQAVARSNSVPVLFSSLPPVAGGLSEMRCPRPDASTGVVSSPVPLQSILAAAAERRASAASQDAVTRFLLEDRLIRQQQAPVTMMAAGASHSRQHEASFQRETGALPHGIQELALQRLTELSLRRSNQLPAMTPSQEVYYGMLAAKRGYEKH